MIKQLTPVGIYPSRIRLGASWKLLGKHGASWLPCPTVNRGKHRPLGRWKHWKAPIATIAHYKIRRKIHGYYVTPARPKGPSSKVSSRHPPKSSVVCDSVRPDDIERSDSANLLILAPNSTTGNDARAERWRLHTLVTYLRRSGARPRQLSICHQNTGTIRTFCGLCSHWSRRGTNMSPVLGQCWTARPKTVT